jgi:hypothetical protein
MVISVALVDAMIKDSDIVAVSLARPNMWGKLMK